MWIWQPLLLLMFFGTKGSFLPLHSYTQDDLKPKSYSFSYGVKDSHTGDVKHHWEKKNGDSVKGQYSVVEPDGTIRTVDYTVDKHSGFNAVVKHSGPTHHYAKVEHTVKPEYHFGDSTNELKHYVHQEIKPVKYVYVPDDGQAKESISTTIKVPAPKYKSKEPFVTNYIAKVPREPAPIVEHQSAAKLPIDLNLVKQGAEKVIPVDVSLLQPVELDLSHKQTELSSENLKKFLTEYYGSAFEQLIGPNLGTGFQPLKPTVTIANTYTPKKKPITTPGLRNYATKPKHRFRIVDSTF